MSTAAWTADAPSACKFTHQSPLARAAGGRWGSQASRKRASCGGTPADVCTLSASAGSPASSAAIARRSTSKPSRSRLARFAPPSTSLDAPPTTRTSPPTSSRSKRMPALALTGPKFLPKA